MGSWRILVLLLILTACAPAKQPPPPTADHTRVSELEQQVSQLTAETEQARGAALERENRELRAAKENQELQDSYRRALQSPGYEAALRLVYQRLQNGDAGPLRSLLSPDEPVEAGMHAKGRTTYRPYPPGEAVDLDQFLDWAKAHPLETGRFSVVARYLGYAWAVVDFPDGTHFRIFFTGRRVTKVLASDQPMELS